MKRTVAIALLALSSSLASAHHGTAGQFDQTKTIKISGVVTQLKLVNPHSYIYFEVKNDSGGVDAWRCEMRAGALLIRSGWSAEMFKAGTKITVTGFPARREPHGCYADEVEIDGGKTLQHYTQLEGADKGVDKREARRADGKPNFAGNWAANQRLLGSVAARAGGPAGPGAAGPGAPGPGAVGPAGPGAPGARAGGPARYQQTDAGTQASAGFNRDNDNPRYHCQATNIFADWTFDQHINQIEQTATTITIKYGFMDLVRTIHLNMAAHPSNLKPSRAGHSIGKWDGDTLVVDTIGFLPGYLEGNSGVKHSDKLHVVEKFSLGTDAKSLVRTWVGDDSLYLKAPFEGRDEIFASGAKYIPYACNDLTQEVVPGF